MNPLSDFATGFASESPQKKAALPESSALPTFKAVQQRNPLSAVPVSNPTLQVPKSPNANAKEAIHGGAQPVALAGLMAGVGMGAGKGDPGVHWTTDPQAPAMSDLQKRYNIQSVQNKDTASSMMPGARASCWQVGKAAARKN